MSIQEFQEKGYTLVRNAVTQDLTKVITQYALFDEMQDFLPEGAGKQVPTAHTKYADPMMESMLLYMLPMMEESTGLSLAPTYSYYRVYRNGNELARHKDRPSCEISATVCFGFSYDSEKFNWPIYMDGNSVNMLPGDVVIYRGVDLDHWREPFMASDDDWHVQAFIHYVDLSGPYAEWKFDKRSSIGIAPTSRSEIQTNVKKTDKSYLIWT